MLYNDEPTVLVRTVPAFLLVIATIKFKDQHWLVWCGKESSCVTYPILHGRKDNQQSMM